MTDEYMEGGAVPACRQVMTVSVKAIRLDSSLRRAKDKNCVIRAFGDCPQMTLTVTSRGVTSVYFAAKSAP